MLMSFGVFLWGPPVFPVRSSWLTCWEDREMTVYHGFWSQSSWRGLGKRRGVSDYHYIDYFPISSSSHYLFPVLIGIPKIGPFLVHFLYSINLLFQWPFGFIRQRRQESNCFLQRPQNKSASFLCFKFLIF